MKRAPRGSAILEVLIAGTILLIGMSGICLLLLNAYSESREANFTVLAAQFASRRVQEFTVTGTTALASMGTGNAPTGQPVPEDNRFSEAWAISNQSGNGVTAYQVDVTVTWNGSNGRPRQHLVSLVVSDIPDGGSNAF